MRYSMLLAAALIITAVPTARAVPLQDCSQGATEKRIACLQANIVLLNSSHEAVAAELRKAITDLNTTVGALTTKVGTLTTDVNAVKGQIPKLDSVVIQWFGHDNSCITYLGGGTLTVRDTCLDPNQNRFVVRPYHP